MVARKLFVALWLGLCGMTSLAHAAEVVRAIVVDGMRYSQDALVLRELPFAVGDEWQDSYATLSEKRLRNLGLFSDAVVSPPDADGVVRIWARDRWSLWLLPEASRSESGASSAGIALTEHNLWGLNHYLRAATRWNTGKNFSQNDGQSYDLAYKWRRIQHSNWDVELGVRRGFTLQDMFQLGVFSSVYSQYQKMTSLGVRYGLGDVPNEGWNVGLSLLQNDVSYTLLQGPALTDVQNYRDRAMQWNAHFSDLDDHLTWLTGTSFDYTLDVGHKLLGATNNVYRQTLSWREHRVWSEDNHSTLDMRLDAGLATGNVLRDVLFDVGGKDGLRGYFPGDLQGNAYAYAGMEHRRPLSSASNVQWVGFVDMGHVSQQGSAVLDKPWIVGVGTGARWTMRWLVGGTFRADVAYGFAKNRWRFHIGTGQSF